MYLTRNMLGIYVWVSCIVVETFSFSFHFFSFVCMKTTACDERIFPKTKEKVISVVLQRLNYLKLAFFSSSSSSRVVCLCCLAFAKRTTKWKKKLLKKAVSAKKIVFSFIISVFDFCLFVCYFFCKWRKIKNFWFFVRIFFSIVCQKLLRTKCERKSLVKLLIICNIYFFIIFFVAWFVVVLTENIN